MDSSLLIKRVKGRVEFVKFQHPYLYYRCDDGFLFTIHIDDTLSGKENKFTGDIQKGTPFPAKDKAILYMRWIRKEMREQDGSTDV